MAPETVWLPAWVRLVIELIVEAFPTFEGLVHTVRMTGKALKRKGNGLVH